MSNEALRETKIIEGRDLLRQYLELRDIGYVTVWTGEGKICLRAPRLLSKSRNDNLHRGTQEEQ